MKALNQLCAIYLAAASAYAVAVVLDRHPQLDAAAHRTAAFAARQGGEAAVALNDHLLEPGWVLVARQSGRAYDSLMAVMHPPVRTAKADRPAPVKTIRLAKAPPGKAPPARVTPAPAAPDTPVQMAKVAPQGPALRPQIVPAVPKPPVQVAAVAPAPRPAPPRRGSAPENSPARTEVAVNKLPPPSNAAPSAETARVEEHLRAALTHELYANFDLFLYVSKAAKGPVAQHMYVFDKSRDGGLALRYDWPVSTGREKVEYNDRGWKLPSFTPAGYYELDPHRMYRDYHSVQWGVPMPHAMFFNWVHDGSKTGLAIHAASGAEEIGELGSRASAGCVRLSPENARALFDLVKDNYRGDVPRFAVNRKTDTMSNKGELMRDADGKLRFIKGYRVLVYIENFGGGEDVVATIG